MAYSYDDYGWYSLPGETEDNYQDATWLDRNYGGAPNECSWHFINSGIVKLVNGECPKQYEHN
jgi:hypothetical protein